MKTTLDANDAFCQSIANGKSEALKNSRDQWTSNHLLTCIFTPKWGMFSSPTLLAS
jgi:hypothetical protein